MGNLNYQDSVIKKMVESLKTEAKAIVIPSTTLR